MSGIAGIFYRNNKPVLSQQLQAMGTALAHRGPDGIKYFCKDSIGFVHCMLHDTPESLFETLPNRSENDTFVLTFHGRIDNRQELYDKIGWGKPLSAVTDSDLVLAAYSKWRKECTNYLVGDFAFAIWDQIEQKMFCARDHMGVKPFYYYLYGNVFAFASEIKGLLALPEILRVLNEERVVDFLTCIVRDMQSTFYRNIYRLPPAHFIEIFRKNTRLQRYYELAPSQTNSYNSTENEERFRELFVQAVRCRIRSAYTVGSYLSGGLDSASIVCVAAGVLKRELAVPLHTFSGIFEDNVSCDERKYFQSVIKRYQVIPHFLNIDGVNPSIIFDKIVALEDEPFWAPHVFMSANIMPIARDLGVRVLLDGHDGDAAVSYGYRLLNELARAGRMIQLGKVCRAIGYRSFPRMLKKILRVYGDIILNNSPILDFLFQERKVLLEGIQVLNQTLRKKNDAWQRYCSTKSIVPHQGQSERTYHKLNLTQPIHAYALEFFDKITTSSGLSNRYPFFDKRIIEFCLSVPAEQKLSDGKNRSIVRRALAECLPDSVRERVGKTDFTPSLIHGYTVRDRKWLDFSVDSLGELSYKYVDRDYCLSVRRKVKDTKNNGQVVHLSKLLSIISFSKWIRTF